MMHKVFLLLGSNMNPQKNIRLAIDKLREHCQVLSTSRVWKTKASGTVGPDFLNQAVVIETSLSKSALKESCLAIIENQLGRKRTSNKYAPRTIDLDIIVFDDEILDDNLWTFNFIALPMAEIYPNLHHPSKNKTLRQIADEIRELAPAAPYTVKE
jgi:2-amino-4-hydroxy-6-hydroxymethyldihydropteridine diphosphokinase